MAVAAAEVQTDPSFDAAVQTWPAAAQVTFSEIRKILREVAAQEGIALQETTKWGEPSWLPRKRGIGSTLRAGWREKSPDSLSLFVNCQTDLVEQVTRVHHSAFSAIGSRELVIQLSAPLPRAAIAFCAVATLTYHRKT